MIRVAVIDDSPTVRAWVVQELSAEHGFSVVAEAADGREGLEAVARVRPDIVVMDVDMPRLDGVSAAAELMRATPTPILLFTSSALARSPRVAVEGLAAGALDVMAKPSFPAAAEAGERLRKTLRLLAPIKVIRRTGPRALPPAPILPLRPVDGPLIVAIGASTGGPAALIRALVGLTPAAASAFLVVQHMAAEFMPGLRDWLADNLSLPVKAAGEGAPVVPGTLLLAPGDRHLRMGPTGALSLDASPPRHSCRPAVDVLFESLALYAPHRTIGVLLTGMGEDGAAGLLQLRRAGGLTIAQDEESSVVYGMPKAAVDRGAAAHVLSLEAINEVLSRAARGEVRR